MKPEYIGIGNFDTMNYVYAYCNCSLPTDYAIKWPLIKDGKPHSYTCTCEDCGTTVSVMAKSYDPEVYKEIYKDNAKKAIIGFTEFMKGITGNKDLKIPEDIAKKYDIEQEPCEMTAEEYRQRMIQAFHNADCDELIAICVLPTEKEFEHLEWLLEKHYKAKPEPSEDAIKMTKEERAELLKGLEIPPPFDNSERECKLWKDRQIALSETIKELEGSECTQEE